MPLATCMKLQISKSSVDWGKKKKNNNAQSKSASYVFIGDLSEDFPTQVGKIPWRRQWHPTPVFLPGESHGRGSLVGYSPRGRKELDTTERLHFYFTEDYSLRDILSDSSKKLFQRGKEGARIYRRFWKKKSNQVSKDYCLAHTHTHTKPDISC